MKTTTDISTKIAEAVAKTFGAGNEAYAQHLTPTFRSEADAERFAAMTLTITQTMETRHGIAWIGKITDGATQIYVEDEGDGGCFRYDSKVGYYSDFAQFAEAIYPDAIDIAADQLVNALDILAA